LNLIGASSRNWLNHFCGGGWCSYKRQTKLNLQATFGTIGSSHSASVKTYGALGNSKTETDPSGLPATRVIEAIERLKEFFQGIGRDARTTVCNLYHCLCPTRSLGPYEKDLHRRAFAGVANGIAHDIFDGAVQ
jgi:hypothetical protein